jgi:hypothetical protein
MLSQFGIYSFLLKKSILSSLSSNLNNDTLLNSKESLNKAKSKSEAAMLMAENTCKKIYLTTALEKASINGVKLFHHHMPEFTKFSFLFFEAPMLSVFNHLTRKVFVLNKTPLNLGVTMLYFFTLGAISFRSKDNFIPELITDLSKKMFKVIQFAYFASYLIPYTQNTPLGKLMKIFWKEISETDLGLLEEGDIDIAKVWDTDLVPGISGVYETKIYDNMLPLKKVTIYHEGAKSWSSKERKLLENNESVNANIILGLKLAAKEAKENNGQKTELQLSFQSDKKLQEFALGKLYKELEKIKKMGIGSVMKDIQKELLEAFDFVNPKEEALAGEEANNES